MKLFRYPEIQHVRTQSPDHFSYYKRYKPFLRIEFERRCVFCLLPDGLTGEEAFGVDHYRPISRFPDLKCDYSNLLYACNTCNGRKKDFWPTSAQWSAALFLPNPCDHKMAEHLAFVGPHIEPRTVTGRFTIETLRLNDPGRIQLREFILRSIDRCTRLLKATRIMLAEVEARLSVAQGIERYQLTVARSSLLVELDGLQADLLRLTG